VAVKLTNANPYKWVNDLIVARQTLKEFLQPVIRSEYTSVHCPGITIIKSLKGYAGDLVMDRILVLTILIHTQASMW
jgi:hypothetical protein